jgi:multisubunit Na+/H+ antiporter MnhE subunit
MTRRYNPPQLVEAVMLGLSLALCAAWWIRQDWQYLTLCLSYLFGAITSILIREWVTPSPHTKRVRLAAIGCFLALASAAGFYFLQTHLV